jgi:hypothetical protein
MRPNHTLFAQVITLGLARWEPSTKELCYSGMRHSLELDGYGVPLISQSKGLFEELTQRVKYEHDWASKQKAPISGSL